MKSRNLFATSAGNRFVTKIHTRQISDFLPLLNERAIGLVNGSQEATDSLLGKGQYTNDFHFDNNKIHDATLRIRRGYEAALDAFDREPDQVFVYFGQITHALQDFYSHSNWYELMRAGFLGDRRLLDEGYGEFGVLKPLERIGRTRVVALEKGFRDPLTEWGRVGRWEVDPASYVVSAKTDQGDIIGGLMTGEVNGLLYGAGNSVELVDPITNRTYPGFDHGGLARTISRKYLGPLAKDKVSDRFHLNVLELARDQVQHELVRLMSLVQARYGDSGLKKFANLFVRDGKHDEFNALIAARDLRIRQLREQAELNVAGDNGLDDQVLNPFFDGLNPEVPVAAATQIVPSELQPYADQVMAGDFRWMLPASGGQAEAVLEIYAKGNWLKTDFTATDMENHL